MSENEKNTLCCDLDGTLVKCDSLLETIFIAIKKDISVFFLIPYWVWKGKSYFKAKIAECALPNPSLLPYNKEVIDYIKDAKLQGRKTVLATASSQTVADLINNELNIFDVALGSTYTFNLRAKHKKDRLVELFGHKKFDYIGDSSADFPVWEAAGKAILVNPSKRVLNTAKKNNNVETVIENIPRNKLAAVIKEIRVYQWIKNILIFLPMLLAHRLDLNMALTTLFGFVAFSLVSSFIYVWNDLFDIESDRKHPYKKNRPIASGNLKSIDAIAVSFLLLFCGGLISIFTQNLEFNLILIAYIILTSCYSFRLKKYFAVDIVILALLYTLRLIAGAASVEVHISQWLLTFSIFIFLSLAAIKRYIELDKVVDDDNQSPSGRGYIKKDLQLVNIIATVSGYLSVLVYILYVNSIEVIRLYQSPVYLWAVAVCLLLWVTRMLFVANRGIMHYDPIIFASKDGFSYLIGLITVILVILAAIL